MKKIILGLAICLLSFNLFSIPYQIVTPTLNVYDIDAEDLLNTYVIFQDNFSHEFALNIEVYYSNEYSSEALVLTISTPSISLQSNVSIINTPQGVELLSQLEFHHTDFYNYYLTHGKFISGRYHICYIFTELAEPQPKTQCIDLDSPIQTTLHLVSPSDESEIHSYNPVLSWIYSQDLLPGYQYMLTLAEKDSAQTPEEAILNNPSLLITYLEDNYLFYPITAVPIEDCKEYAWKVDVIGESQLILTSEIWYFKVECPDSDTTPKPDFYFPLSLSDQGQIYHAGHYLPFMFDQPYQKITESSIDIYNSDGTLLLSNAQINEVRTNVINKCYNGYNLFLINLNKAGIVDPGLYILTFKNQKHTYFLRFKLE